MVGIGHDSLIGLLEEAEKKKKEAFLALQGRWRFVFLGLVCFVEFGRYYCVDLVSPLQKVITTVSAVLRCWVAIRDLRDRVQLILLGVRVPEPGLPIHHGLRHRPDRQAVLLLAHAA